MTSAMHKFFSSLILIAASVAHAQTDDGLVLRLSRLAPEANPSVISLGVRAAHCAASHESEHARTVAIIDYSKPSTEVRMWVFDLASEKLLYAERVSHGQGSGDNFMTRYSNRSGSHQTSIGLFRTGDEYHGKNGYSMRLHGLDSGYNDKAYERAIVVHGAPYVSDSAVKQLGRLGRSWGCPAVRLEVANKLIDDLKGGNYLFAYYPDEKWLAESPWFDCESSEDARRTVHSGLLVPVDEAIAGEPAENAAIMRPSS
ncbi:murein L,D-transpeptidase catalytic domain family protein [Dokdonella sp.]|uniref:murein L,D-transpeptidase catalytic domain family protein n=1 Tax=Dokdonella sp. TaxID=2291710 RepID=UPI003526FF91